MKTMMFVYLTCALTAFSQAPAILHQVNPTYPPAASLHGVEGTVTVELDLDSRGMVADARVLTGPQQLRAAALKAALEWQFAPTGKDVRTRIDLDFRLKTERSPSIGALKAIEFHGVPPELETRARPHIPLAVGDAMPADGIDAIRQALTAIEPPLSANLTADNTLRVEMAPRRLRIGGNAQSAKITRKVAPLYPAEARQQRIQGTVRLEAIIDRQGAIYRLDLIGGHPLLADAALPAVRQWRYEPTLLNGEPVEVITMIDVNFTLTK